MNAEASVNYTKESPDLWLQDWESAGALAVIRGDFLVLSGTPAIMSKSRTMSGPCARE